MRFFNFVITLFLLTTALNLNAQAQQQDSIVLEKIIGQSKKLSDQHPSEKVYVHFDKPYYSVGDTIWFKAYLTMETNMPSLLSKIVYVDVINSRDSLVQSIKLPVVNSVASGNVPIVPGNYQQGNYYIKAYTLWMMNDAEDYFFNKTIPIGEAVNKQLITQFSYKTTQTEKNQTIDALVQFKNKDGVVQASKAVTWKVLSNFDIINKGKGTTDQNGFLKVKIDAKKNEPITNGELLTEITLGLDDMAPSRFKIQPSQSDYDFQFFPEGGELISGIATRIGFKALNSTGLGADLKGTVTDNQGNSMTTFTSSHLGMGSFYLNSEKGKTYKATISFKDGIVKSYDLPKSLPSGVAIQVANTEPTELSVKIVANETYFNANKDKRMFIVVTNNGVITYAAKTSLKTQLVLAKVPKKELPTGIAQITLFDNLGEPISERLSFIPQNNALTISVKTDLAAYKPRQKVKLSVAGKNGTTFADGNYSVSVTDEQKVPVDEDSERTILSSVLLTSELKGYVEKPNYYFNKPDEKKAADLDVLLLTQGFRRFNYKDVMATKFPPSTLLPEQGLRVTGTLRDRTGMPVKKGALRMTIAETKFGADAVTNPSGLFVFNNLNIPDSAEVIINAKYSAGGSSLMILLDGQPTAPITKNIHGPDEITNIDSALAPYLANSKKQYNYLTTLKEVKIEGAKVKRPSHSDHSAFIGLSNITGNTIEGDRFKGCNSVAICLQGMAVGLTYFENNFYVSRDYQQGKKVPVQIFLDATPIDYFSLLSVSAEDIESVEVFPRDELGTINRLYNTNGLVIINMKAKPKGTKISLQELKSMMPKANLLKFKPKGFSKQREFYSPKYVNAANTYNFNDLRSTIYWNSKLATTAATTEPLSLEYYNGDGNGTYRVVVEGIDKLGNVARSVYRYTVK
ncbi:carboxypeptidase-like regulatory domain-containing protein [Pedobacter sp. JCM 36344]|uniref:carboxypeptidase-like regulatory domain-containing protein n=1 Tax=Pedobacter sp. JCM 36344 TaxID=3374280 RepID=UPI00397806B2